MADLKGESSSNNDDKGVELENVGNDKLCNSEDQIQAVRIDTNDPSSDDLNDQPKIQLHALFPSFISLRNALDKYQKENHVQLVVKDSKLLSAESTRKVIQKVYHLVNQSLMYHSITYYCKCHGALKQKPGSRIKNIGAKRLNCPVYLRFKLSTDLQSLVLFDMFETHNHATDPNTFQLSPRQQVYRLTRMRRGEPDPIDAQPDEPEKTTEPQIADVQTLFASAIKVKDETDYEPPIKKVCTANVSDNTGNDNPPNTDQTKQNDVSDSERGDDDETGYDGNEIGDDENNEEDDDEDLFIYKDSTGSPLDPESSCSDSDEEEFRKNRHLLTYPIRLIGSAVQCSPELMSLTKQLIETQKENLLIEKKKLILETKQLELQNAKLSLEVKDLEKNFAAASGMDQATTFYLQG